MINCGFNFTSYIHFCLASQYYFNSSYACIFATSRWWKKKPYPNESTVLYFCDSNPVYDKSDPSLQLAFDIASVLDTTVDKLFINEQESRTPKKDG